MYSRVLIGFALLFSVFSCTNPVENKDPVVPPADTTAPQWASGFPVSGTINATSADFNVKIDENGKIYSVAVPLNSPAPIVPRIMAGKDAAGQSAISASVNLNAGSAGVLTLTTLVPGTDYDVYFVGEDSAGNLMDAPSKLTIKTPSSDNTPPLWAAAYPGIANISASSVDLKGKINETGTMWTLVVPQGSAAPTADQVKAKSNYGSVVLTASGQSSLSANTEGVIALTGLNTNTAYDLYSVASDAAGNLMATPWKGSFTTLNPDITPPVWAASYPSAANIATTAFDVKFKSNESGKVYYMLVADGVTAPTSAQIKSGTFAGALKTGQVVVTANTEASGTITGLSSSTSYDLYAVAEDNIPNLQAAGIKIDVTTQGGSDITPPSWTAAYPQLANAAAASVTLKGSISESGKLYYIVVAAGSIAPTNAQVKAGVSYAGVTIVKSANANVSASTVQQFDITGLVETETYDIYVVGEDSIPNLMATPAKLTLQVTELPAWSLDPSSTTTAQKVALTCGTSGAVISYTMDGSTPDGVVDGTVEKLYSNPVDVSTGGTLKAIALKSGSRTSVVLNAGTFPLALGYHAPKTGAFAPVDKASWSTAAYSLGARFTSGAGSDGTFALYSKNATKVVLEIYESAFGSDAKWEYEMAKGSDQVWRAKVGSLPDKTLYGFRVWGPNFPFDTAWKRGANSSAGFISDADASANRFNPNKVVYDPYARELSHDDESIALKAAGLDGRVYAASGALYSGAPYSGLAYRAIDTGKYVPKGILFADSTSYGTKPALPKKDAMIYEAHLRGLSKSDTTGNLSTILAGMSEFDGIQDIPADERGTYLGAAKMAKYLKGLGFNTIEFLPLHECFNNEMNDSVANTNQIIGQENFWGYMTANFFAPERRYAKDQTPGGPTREFKQMVKAFHDAGIEVYVDVVYNHTGEGGPWGDTNNTVKITSFRGIDNTAYYQLINGGYQNDTGCGNNFAGASSAPAKQLVLDSLTYWIDDLGVDGFRFDLAPVLGRDNFTTFWAWNSSADLLNKINTLGNSKNAEMIAEAWDLNAYVLHQFPGNWSDWNGLFRDNIRNAVNGGYWGKIGDIMQGSSALGYSSSFPQSVNFVTAHDGLTLMDVVSYSGSAYASVKYTQNGVTFYGNNTNMNLAWPFGPSDGGNSDGSQSSDWGGNQALRRQALRNYWTITYFSKGIPMSLYGDEFARTQNGNNNTYNVDSVATWNNYGQINTDSPTKASLPVGTYHDNFGTDTHGDSKNALFQFVKKLLKIRATNSALREMSTPWTNWASADSWASTGSFTIDGGSYGNFFVMVNMSGSDKTFTIPAAGSGWKRIIATGPWAEVNDNYWPLASAAVISQSTYTTGAKEIVILQK